MTQTDEPSKPVESPVPIGEAWPGSAGEPAEQEVQQPETSKDARNMAMLCHLLGLVGFLAPLVIWLIEKDKHRFVDEHGRAAMNYQISIMIYYFVSWALCFVIIGFFLVAALTILHVIFVIVGAVKASKGKPWRYPIAITFLR